MSLLGSSPTHHATRALSHRTAYRSALVCAAPLVLVLWSPAGATQQLQRDAHGVTLRPGPITTRIELWGDRIVRVTHAPASATGARSSLSVVGTPAAVAWRFGQDAAHVTLSTGRLAVRVDKATGQVGFLDASGTLVTGELGPAFLRATVVGGAAVLAAEQRFGLAPGEAIYGLGQHQDGVLDYRDATVHLQQENREVAVPVLVSSRGYGVFWDNPAVTDVNVGGGEQGVIPPSQLLTEDGVRGGLTARYYEGRGFDRLVATRVDPKVDFRWGVAPPPGVASESYSVRWTGSLEAKQDGEYVLLVTAEGGVRVFLDDQLVIDAWVLVGPSHAHRARLRLAAGSRHPIRIEYGQGQWGATARLAWRLPAVEPAVVWTSEAAQAVDYYFLYGPELDEVVGGYRQLTGDAPLLPKWAFGLWQSRERYETQSEILGVLAEYRRRRIPLDGVIQDWQYWKPGAWGSHEFDPERFPDPTAMVEQIHRAGAHVLVSVWPRFDQGLANLAEIEKAGAVFPPVYPNVYPKGEGKWYDAFHPDGRRVYWRQLSQRLFARGFDGWWLDASEAELGGHWGEMRDLATGAGPGALVYNAYPLSHTAGVHDGQRAETSDKRAFILTRSAYAGQQRNSAVTWSGDILGDWTVFARQIPAGLNFSLTGIPYWNTDIGGFFGGDPADPAYSELFTRWYQFGAFCGMFRVHGTGKPKETWRFDEATQKILRDYDELRYHLLPYTYSLAWMVTHDRYTLMRPLVMDFRGDARARGIADQFLFGPAIMANPVVERAATRRAVYLPAGTRWTDFWTGESVAGGQQIEAEAPLQTMPLFVRAGSIIPLGPPLQYVSEKPADPLELRVYPGADGRFTLYEDEGDGYKYERGEYTTIELRWDERRQTLTIGPRQGRFPGMLQERRFRVVWVVPRHGRGVESTAAADSEVTYRGQPVTVRRSPRDHLRSRSSRVSRGR